MRSQFFAFLIVLSIGELVLIWLAANVSNWFVVPMLLLLIVWGLLTEIKFKCPQCGKSILINPVRILGTDVWLATPLIPAKCSRCGAELE